MVIKYFLKGLFCSTVVCNVIAPTAKKPLENVKVEKKCDRIGSAFDRGMNYWLCDDWGKQKTPLINLCRDLYEKNNLENLRPLEKPIIPKIIHLIWLGHNDVPSIFVQCLRSVIKYAPDWTIKIWTDADIMNLDLKNKQYFDEETNFGAKADILRYELLYKFGGVYLDIDMVLLKSIDVLVHTYEFFTGLESTENEATLGNAIIGSIPGHPILKESIETIKDSRSYHSVYVRTGPVHFQKAFERICQNYSERVIALPQSYFYPVSFNNSDFSDEKKLSYIKPETFCLHHWSGSWVTK